MTKFLDIVTEKVRRFCDSSHTEKERKFKDEDGTKVLEIDLESLSLSTLRKLNEMLKEYKPQNARK